VRRRLAVLTVVAISLTACAKAPPTNRDTPPGDALPALLDALQKTNDVPSGRMAVDLTFTSPEETFHITGDVEYIRDPQDPASLRERVLLDIPSMGMMPGGEVEMIIGKGSVIYVRAPMLASDIPSTTRWIKLDPSRLPGSEGGFGAATAAADPATILAAIKDALTVQEVGADTVDGAETTRYRATVDIVKLLPLLARMSDDEPTDADMREARDQLEKLGLDMLPIDLWVDDAGFVKQIRLNVDMTDVEPNRHISFALTLTFSDFGEPVSIDIPPASQVTDITDTLEAGSASATLA
jgi:hypothetical protein